MCERGGLGVRKGERCGDTGVFEGGTRGYSAQRVRVCQRERMGKGSLVAASAVKRW